MFFFIRYLREAPELQVRRLADLAFLVQMYESAYNSYRTAKRDFSNDQAWMHSAGAMVGITIKLVLLSLSEADYSQDL